jgi:SAM-dependent methyltransferase
MPCNARTGGEILAYAWGRAYVLRAASHTESNMEQVSEENRLRPLDWPPIKVDVRVPDEQLSAMIGRVEAMFKHLEEVDPAKAAALADTYRAAFIMERDPKFFESGRIPVNQFVATLARYGIAMDGLDTCFELGCGLGRSTIWLAEHFRQVTAADISAPHLRATKENAANFGRTNIAFVHTNKIGSYREVPRFDVLFSIAVLQHNPPPVIRHILDILLGKLNSGAIGYFQVPTYRLGYSFDVASYLSAPPRHLSPEMHVFPQPELFALIEERGCRLIEIREEGTAGGNNISSRVLVQKK